MYDAEGPGDAFLGKGKYIGFRCILVNDHILYRHYMLIFKEPR